MTLLRARFSLFAAITLSAAAAGAQSPAAQSPAAQSSAVPSPFGPNVFVLEPGMSSSDVQARIDRVYSKQRQAEFGPGRYAFLLNPGEYKLDIPIGFYTQVLGLGETPDKVHVQGDVHVDAAARGDNATTTFWRGAEGFSVTPPTGTLQWAVSQAVSFRRMHVLGSMVLNQKHGWASGGWMADTVVDGTVNSGTQQQWISRNTEWKEWVGSNWNMVFVGVNRPPAGDWPEPPYTKVATTPLVREKPFLIAKGRRYSMVVPAVQISSTGAGWHRGETPGKHIPLESFYIASPLRDSAASINAALRRGKHLLLTPGTYDLKQPIHVTRKDTVVYGLGFATLHPVNGTAAMMVDDVDGVIVAGLLIDAGSQRSPQLLVIGEPGSRLRHVSNPITLSDIFFRVGGADVGQAGANLVINSNDTLVDHTWIWRADHGKGVGWTENLSDNGLIVNGNDVTIYGLFVEHHQQYQVLWNGERGRTYFYQSEIPYDPPTQLLWSSAPGLNGWASYKVNDKVTHHEAWGLGVYSVFRKPGVTLTHAFEVPETPDVRFHHMITVALDDLGEITHVIDGVGENTTTGPRRRTPKISEFPLP